MDIKQIIELARQDRFAVKKHAATRMKQRSITVDNIKDVLLSPKIVETYEDDYPFSSCLILGYADNEPLHVVIAISNIDNILLVITAYRPSTDEWLSGFTERKHK